MILRLFFVYREKSGSTVHFWLFLCTECVPDL